jgi:L-2-hydroxyglutarate oxidase LhgO
VSGIWLRCDNPTVSSRHDAKVNIVLTEQRFAALREFFPEVNEQDWHVEEAGQGVQIIKRDPVHGGILEFGTELVTAADGSMVAMLGASPGAATAVWIMIQVIERCFAERLKNAVWSRKLQEMIPSYGHSLADVPGQSAGRHCRRVAHQLIVEAYR